jgi:uncharacterized membrane protein
MPPPSSPRTGKFLNLAELHRIRRWHVAHQEEHPLELHVWDAVLTLWLLGWIGWLPALLLNLMLALPLCLLGMAAPQMYVRWRARAHRARRLRCDWLNALH